MKPVLDWPAPAAKSWVRFRITVHESGGGLEFSQTALWLAELDGWSMHDAVRLFQVSDGGLATLLEYRRTLWGLRDPEDGGECSPMPLEVGTA